MISPNLFYFLSVPFFHSFSLLIRAGNLANTSGAEQPHAHEQPHPNGIRAHTDRHAITNDPDNLHAMSNHTP